MKRSLQISAIVAFAFAAVVASNAQVSNLVTDSQPNKGSSAGYEFEEIETAEYDIDRSNGYEFEEVETAQNELDRSKGFDFEEVETAKVEQDRSKGFEFKNVETA